MGIEEAWTWQQPVKEIRSGTDRLHRPYVALEWHNADEKKAIFEWLDEACPEAWCSLGITIWFTNESDRTAFLLRWS